MSKIIVFDGVCGFCNRWVDFVLKHDERGTYRFAANQSPAGREVLDRFGVPPGDVNTLYLVDGDRIHNQSAAAIRILVGLGFPWAISGIFWIVPRVVRDAGYRWIARNRYRWFGKRDACRMPTARDRDRFLADPPGVAAS